MLAVKEEYRGKGIATKLVRMAIDAMIARNADEVRFLVPSTLLQICDPLCSINLYRSPSRRK